jgi:hypothetical protein
MKRIFSLILMFTMLLTSSFFSAVYAGTGDEDTVVVLENKADGAYITFNISVPLGTTNIRYRAIGFNISIGGSTIIYKYEAHPGSDLPYTFKLSSIISEFDRQYADYGGTNSSQYKSAYDAMFKTGGTITFNALMTVVYSGVKQGDINDGARYPDSYSSNFQGRVYGDLSSIQNAEDWNSDTIYRDLPKYFNISYTFPKQNDPPATPIQVIVSYWGVDADGSHQIQLLPNETINDEVQGDETKTITAPRKNLPPEYTDYIYESYGTNTVGNGVVYGEYTNNPATVEVSRSIPTMYLRFKYRKTGTPPIDPGGGGGGDIIFEPESANWTNSGKTSEGHGSFPVRVYSTVTSKIFTGTGKRTTIIPQPPIPGGTDAEGNSLPDIPQPDLVIITYENFPVTYNLGSITVSGFGSGNFSGSGGTVNLITEGTSSMTAVGAWGPPVYSAPSGLTDLQIPSPPSNPTGTSGTYKLDWTTPVLTYNSASSTGGSWSRNPFPISFSLHENLSGFSGTNYNITDSSWYNKDSSGSAPDGGMDYSRSLTLMDGIYNVSINYGDVAGNKGTKSFGEYLVDTTSPDTAGFLFDTTTDINIVSTTPSKCIYRNGRYEFMCDANNQVKIRIGDNLSGVTETRYLWSQSSSFPSTASMSSISQAVTTERVKSSKDLAIYFNGNTNYQGLKKGLWYLHIYQRDRAGNETRTTSPQIFINKVENLRTTVVYDPRWKQYFEKETNLAQNPLTQLQIDGIKVADMPIQKNKEQFGIKLGYMVRFKIDSVGFKNPQDVMDITAHFFAMDKKGYIYPADVYVPDRSGAYRLLQNSEYAAECQHLTVSSASRLVSEPNPADPEYNTWTFQYYVPYSAKAVRQGTALDLYNPNAFDNKLLVVFDLRGIKQEGDFCDYTLKETDWAIGNGSVYGYNYPSLNNLTGKGINHGEVFWYNLFETAKDDLQFEREW